MSSTQNAKTRSERAANLRVDRYPWRQQLARFTSLDALSRLGIAVAAAVLITVFVRGWEPPFGYRKGFIPQRAILARVPFKVVDEVKTDALRMQAAREVLCIYQNNREPLIQLRTAVKDAFRSVLDAADATALTKVQQQTLDSFGATVLNPDEKPLTYEQALSAVQTIFTTDTDV